MRTVDATLTAALAAGTGTPFVKAYVGYSNGTVKNSHTNVRRYRLTGTTLEFWIPSVANLASDQEQIWLERGVTIAGTDYTLTTGRFWIDEEEYLPDQVARYKGSIVPPQYFSAAGDVTYETIIDAFFLEYGKTTTYKDDTEAWLDYQFLPAGKFVLMNHAMRYLNMLRQKRLIVCCDNGAEDVRIASLDVIGSPLATISIVDQFSLSTTEQRSRQYIWKDELETVHTDGTTTDPLHNLGYLESTDSPPARNSMGFELNAVIRPDLRWQDGDTLRVSLYGGSSLVTFFAKVSEEYHGQWQPGSLLPRWFTRLEADTVFNNTEGGALPSTIERVSNYTPLNTSNFNNILSEADNNLQAAMNTLDDHHDGGYLRQVLGAARTYYVRVNVGDCTISNASPAVVTKAAHGLSNDDPVVFRTSGALPTGLTAGTVYYVINKAADTFQVSATVGGAAINTSSAGSGTHSVATGKDTNDGLTATRTGALLTIQKAADLAYALDFNTFAVTIQCAKSKYVTAAFVHGVNFIGRPPFQGTGNLLLVGDATTPSNCEISCDRATCIRALNYSQVDVKGFKLTTVTSGSGILANLFAYVNVSGDMEFGAVASYHIYATGMATIQRSAGNVTISGGAVVHKYADDLAWVKWGGGTTTLTGTPAFTQFAHVDRIGNIVDAGTTYSGAATGQRYNGATNGVFYTGGGGANYFPGNAAGATATGAQYV